FPPRPVDIRRSRPRLNQRRMVWLARSPPRPRDNLVLWIATESPSHKSLHRCRSGTKSPVAHERSSRAHRRENPDESRTGIKSTEALEEIMASAHRHVSSTIVSAELWCRRDMGADLDPDHAFPVTYPESRRPTNHHAFSASTSACSDDYLPRNHE